jgi:hypothetical protein
MGARKGGQGFLNGTRVADRLEASQANRPQAFASTRSFRGIPPSMGIVAGRTTLGGMPKKACAPRTPPVTIRYRWLQTDNMVRHDASRR